MTCRFGVENVEYNLFVLHGACCVEVKRNTHYEQTIFENHQIQERKVNEQE